MKKILIFTVFMLIHLACFSQMHHCTASASPYPTQIAQPDGKMIDIKIIGNKDIHYLETIDGYTIMKDEQDDFLKYMIKDGNGDLLLTNIVVNNSDERNNQELVFLGKTEKNLRFSTKILKERTDFLKSQKGNAASKTFPTTGTRRALMLLIDFPDQDNQYTQDEFDNLANEEGYNVNGQSGSFRDYYQDISYGNLTINTDVQGWYTSEHNKDFYGADDFAPNGARIKDVNEALLVREAVDAAEADNVDFSVYDGDGDGAVDIVMIIHSGRGQNESGVADDIWASKGSLKAATQVTYDGVLISDYIIQPERNSSSNHIAHIGTLCHEFGHALGLPDLYDKDHSSSGIGGWGLMAKGTRNNGGRTPAHMCAWSKIQLGWITPTILSSDVTISNFSNMDASASCYKINTTTDGEYFLISNRRQLGWDSHLPGEGLIISHIDDNQIGNSDEDHYKVGIEQADGENDLNNFNTYGDDGDPFPGTSNNTTFDDSTNPNSNLYSGNDSGIAVSNIVESDTNAGFTVSLDCGITAISVSNTSACDTDDYFTGDVTVNYFGRPNTGKLYLGVTGGAMDINTAAFSGYEHTFTGVNIPANADQVVTMTAVFSTEPSCRLTDDVYTGRDCGPCNISKIEDNRNAFTTCQDNDTPNDATDDFFTLDIDVYYEEQPTSGYLVLEGDGVNIYVLASQLSYDDDYYRFDDVSLPANSTYIPLTAKFSTEPSCSLSRNFSGMYACSIDGICDSENITIGGTTIGKHVREVSSTITAFNTIYFGADVTYKAGERIILRNGFHANNNSKFHAYIEGCTTDDTGNKEEIVNNKPMLRNYPNPFTGQTTIEFELTKDTPVTLFVSDVTGRQIVVLLDNDEKTEGTHSVTFDGNNYPAGMYYYTIQAGEYYGTQKMILAK